MLKDKYIIFRYNSEKKEWRKEFFTYFFDCAYVNYFSLVLDEKTKKLKCLRLVGRENGRTKTIIFTNNYFRFFDEKKYKYWEDFKKITKIIFRKNIIEESFSVLNEKEEELSKRITDKINNNLFFPDKFNLRTIVFNSIFNFYAEKYISKNVYMEILKDTKEKEIYNRNLKTILCKAIKESDFLDFLISKRMFDLEEKTNSVYPRIVFSYDPLDEIFNFCRYNDCLFEQEKLKDFEEKRERIRRNL